MAILIENFAADTGQFTTFGYAIYPVGTLAVTGNQGLFTTPSGGLSAITAVENAWTIASPSLFTSAVMGSPEWPFPFPGSYCNIGTGIAKDVNNQLFLECGTENNNANIYLDLLFLYGGSQHNLSTLTIPSTVLPDKIGFGLNGNIATAWLSFGGVWQSTAIGSVDVSSIYDFTAPGALTGWLVGAHQDTASSSTSTTIALSQLQYVAPFAPPTNAITVPNVVNETLAQAGTDIAAANLTVGTITYGYSPTTPIGDIISQNPPAGAIASVGSTVDLVVSALAVVPSVINQSLASARETLANAGFVVGVITYAPSVLIIPGNIILQNPVSGTNAAPGSGVAVEISTGRAPIAVPDLIGLTQANAIAALVNIGLVPGAIGVAASTTVPAGIVISQNIGPGIPYPIYLASGSLVGFVVSSGPPPTDTLFDYGPTVISQYANSPTLLQWLDNMNQYMDQSANFANFLSYVWNVDSAVGFGLDIWGKIVNVSRLLRIPNTTPYVGFDIASESQPAQDWTPAGSNQPPFNNPPVGGAMYTGHNATEAYLLDDNSYRQLILAKAFANICSTTAPALNQILQNLYGVGQAYVLHSGVMAITYNFNFKPTPIQLAILQQSGVIPTPPGVAFSIVTP
jgi:beta-lactam-binding protein with PASTA domain